MSTVSHQQKQTVNAVLFQIGDHSIVIESEFIKEIVEPEVTRFLPNAHPFIGGLFRIRDDIFALIDLPEFIKKDHDQDDDEAKFVILETDRGSFGLRVNKVRKIITLDTSQCSEPTELSPSTRKHLKGIFDWQNQNIYWVDPEKIFNEVTDASAS